jgi:D-3-phosphoglycerate dehydrogenase
MSSISHIGTVLVTGKSHPVLVTSLQKAGYTVINRPQITQQEVEEVISSCSGLVLTTRIKASRSLLEKATSLKWIGRLGSGMELIDTDFAAQKNIYCFSSPEGNRLAVAEHTLGMILGLLHKIASADRQVRNKIWLRDENRGTELSGKTVGIIGYGNTGSELARLLAPFQVRILAYDRFKTGFGAGAVQESTLTAIQEQADIITVHVPLTELTHEMLNTAFFLQLKKAPLLVNTARGQLLNLPDLIQALESGLIRGVALDVLPNESLQHFSAIENEQLASLSSRGNVLLTPHIAGYSHESFERMATVLLEKLGLPPVF